LNDEIDLRIEKKIINDWWNLQSNNKKRLNKKLKLL